MPHLFPSFNGKAPSLIWCVLWATEKLYWVSIPQSFQIPLLTFVVKSSLRNSQFLYSSITFIYLCKLRVCFIPATPFQMAQQKQGPNICILVLILLFFFLRCWSIPCWSTAMFLPKLWLWKPFFDIFATFDTDFLNDYWPTDKQMLFNSGFLKAAPHLVPNFPLFRVGNQWWSHKFWRFSGLSVKLISHSHWNLSQLRGLSSEWWS